MSYSTLYELLQKFARVFGTASINIVTTWPNIRCPDRILYNDDKAEDVENRMHGKDSLAVQDEDSIVTHRRTIIFVRHGQYCTNAKAREDKVLTDLGWRQAYATGCRLKQMGIKISYLIHSDLIRARQTTAAVLAGYHESEDTSDDWTENSEMSVFNLPVLVSLSSRECFSNSGDYSVECSSSTTDFSPGTALTEPKSVPTMKSFEEVPRSIGLSYKPFQSADFICQQSRFLAEGSPPVHPEPPLARPRSEKQLRQDGFRLDAGYETHIQTVRTTASTNTSPGNAIPTADCPKSWTDVQMGSFIPIPPTVDTCGQWGDGSSGSNNVTEDAVVFIGHANVFRYWLCRLLDLPPEAWLRFSIYHGSMTTLVLSYHYHAYTPARPTLSRVFESKPTDRRVTVTATRVGDVGHLPVDWLTR